jgi:hypothetical protein
MSTTAPYDNLETAKRILAAAETVTPKESALVCFASLNNTFTGRTVCCPACREERTWREVYIHYTPALELDCVTVCDACLLRDVVAGECTIGNPDEFREMVADVEKLISPSVEDRIHDLGLQLRHLAAAVRGADETLTRIRHELYGLNEQERA